MPVDADLASLDLTSYPIRLLLKNLEKVPSKNITVILEACFSGISQGGNLLKNSSPIVIKRRDDAVPGNVKIISAGQESEIASWDKNSEYSLFTRYFVEGMSGAADVEKYGNRDGHISDMELSRYFEDTVTYFARRFYGREQKPGIKVGDTFIGD